MGEYCCQKTYLIGEKMRKRFLLTISLLVMLAITFSSVVADDGDLLRKRISYTNVVTVPGYLDEAEHTFIQMMKFYVPAQQANGTVLPIEYYDADGGLVETRELAKPLIGVYMYGPSIGVDGVGFVGHGMRDAYAAVSLDDGNTWKETNLSESAFLTSSDVVRTDIPLFADTDYSYPGDVINMFHAVAGNKVLVAWPSRFCSQGQPNYSMDTDDPTPEQAARRAAIAEYLGIDLATASADDLYLIDMFGVGGQQGSVDYATEDDWVPNQAVGEVPYACLWTARGELVDGDDPRTEVVEESFMRWFKAERLTSGRRDVNRIETMCVEGAGCAVTWQEDPDGLRGGKGLGPGEGWSGATAHSGTDIWYSYIDWDNFDVVQNPSDATGATPMDFLDYEAVAVDTANVTQKPKPFVPFAMPMRLTDNAKCNVENPQPYCNGSAINTNFPDLLVPMDYGLKDMCADTVDIPTGPNDELKPICITQDGMPLVGNTASTRPRLGLFGYDATNDKVKEAVIDSAFVVVVAEEDKGLGAFGFTDDQSDTATACDPEESETCIAFDEGKNNKYFSFSMSLTDAVGGFAEDGLLTNLTHPGNQLNQPEVDWETGEFYPVRNTVDMWDFGEYNFDIYNTEIARRGSLLAQDIAKVHNDTSKAKSGLLVLPSWKQGILNQGGPADVMTRQIIMDKNWKLSKDGNPYAFRNMACDDWAYADGSNPYYPDGLCKDSAINLSATVPDTCTDSQDGGDILCPQVDLSAGTTFGIGDTDPVLQGAVQGEGNTTKVLSWHSCPAEFTTVSGETLDCSTDLRTDDSTLADQSWYNPLDVAKGHRGFLDGDFVMILYAWSPNWRLNTKGSDRYELYVRRSFDGAETWTTLPNNYKHFDNVQYSGDGTVTCETYRSTETGGGGIVEPHVCNSYEAGAAEQPRNVTQLKSMQYTTLDPRYTPTAGSITADPFGVGIPNYNITGEDEDIRDPSRYFIVYETGDNSTTAEGEPEPLDLFYSRAINFGDDYVVWAEEDDLSVCYPSDPHDNTVPEELIGSGFCNEFDQMEQGTPGLEASEASLVANPGGQFLYGAWSQFLLAELPEEESSDAMVRRIWWIDGFIPLDAWIFGQGPQ